MKHTILSTYLLTHLLTYLLTTSMLTFGMELNEQTANNQAITLCNLSLQPLIEVNYMKRIIDPNWESLKFSHLNEIKQDTPEKVITYDSKTDTLYVPKIKIHTPIRQELYLHVGENNRIKPGDIITITQKGPNIELLNQKSEILGSFFNSKEPVRIGKQNEATAATSVLHFCNKNLFQLIIIYSMRRNCSLNNMAILLNMEKHTLQLPALSLKERQDLLYYDGVSEERTYILHTDETRTLYTDFFPTRASIIRVKTPHSIQDIYLAIDEQTVHSEDTINFDYDYEENKIIITNQHGTILGKAYNSHPTPYIYHIE